MSWFPEPRSDDYYDDSDSGGGDSSWSCSEILLLPLVPLVMLFLGVLSFLPIILYFFHDVYSTLRKTIDTGKLSYPFLAYVGIALAVIPLRAFYGRAGDTPVHLTASLFLAIGFIVIFTVLPALALCLNWLIKSHRFPKTKFGGNGRLTLFITFLGICLAAIVLYWTSSSRQVPVGTGVSGTPTLEEHITIPGVTPPLTEPSSSPVVGRQINILVDDFSPQPYQGDDVYYYNRLEGDRGALNNSRVEWGVGQVTATITAGKFWGGIWMSLNHPIREAVPVNFSAVLPPQILPAYQCTITGITVQIISGSPGMTFRVELKDGDQLNWKNETTLGGGKQTFSADLPALQNVNQLVLVLDHAAPGDFVVIDRISLSASTPVTDTATAAFVWSYGMLLNNWDPSTGLVRDKAKDASGEFDAIQATGSLAAATGVAKQLGIIQRADAISIVNKISDTLLLRLPRNHGLWPHWVKVSSEGKVDIVLDSEWSSVDTVIAAIGLLVAQNSLGLDTTPTEQMLREIEWSGLVTSKGISHGYTYSGELIPYAWDTFGGESWLVELAKAGATGDMARLAYPSPPTANGSGFIDELAWLFVLPPSEPDYWGTDWSMYRSDATNEQTRYYRDNDPDSCFARLGLFGVSAAEVPDPSRVPKESIYQAFGLGGQFAPASDGSVLLGAPVVAPHYSAMIASLEPEQTTGMWDWLITQGYFSPLNNVESLAFPVDSNCAPEDLEWNQLKGSWNLALQALGWGRYLAERSGQVPVLWQVTKTNPLLHKGYLLLAPNESSTGFYVPKPNETLAAILENAQISCEGEPLYRWSWPGIYRYRTGSDNDHYGYFSWEQTARWEQPGNGQCPDTPWPSFGGMLIDPPAAGSSMTRSSSCPFVAGVPYSDISISVIGAEKISTGLGTFQAVRVDATQAYRFQTMNHSDPSGIVKVSEWYVCGVGMIRATSFYTWKYQTRDFQSQSELELFSFTPLP